ncbi:hypothetical protein EKQ61_11185 [Staphylococcus gallinarum]|uniref:Phage protein n=1 Tax=Staphylococcus gallinarum TaxID=1293 RepID=A0A0D0SJE9_STAGA|nr:hypothetical protein [Staphylococcus gallinarum]KIR10423.1 hypothetical protein SH09_13275 [Staphylococcus gallinarum]RTX73500.1 hypothetical protein EKQ61_11185 [Staphylococcus gallinarum]GEQ06988.1 hypothetical protein SGA02_28160 [Staphylococcus gallinarum]SUM34055.1 Uncharacterised protein [Staphylococcus gallinarum]
MRGIDDIKQVTDKDEFINILAIEYASNIEQIADEWCGTGECFDDAMQSASDVIYKAYELTGVVIDTEEYCLERFLKRSDGE